MEVSKKCVPLHPRSRKTHKTEQIGAVVQLVRIPACHAGGRGFESRPHREGVTKTSFSYPLSFFFEKRDFLTPVDFRLRPLIVFLRKVDLFRDGRDVVNVNESLYRMAVAVART